MMRRRPRFGAFGFGAFFSAALLLGGIETVPASGEEPGDTRAVYDVGPVRAKGLLFLPVNVIDHYRGEYTIGDHRIVVYFTAFGIERFREWERYECASRPLFLVERNDERSILFFEDDDFALFFAIPSGFDRGCQFVDAFVRRFLYFRQVSEADGAPPFPAILELR
jgi:hypothetical protein